MKYFEPKTRLISITKPVIEDLETPEELVAYTARVSNPGNQLNNETASKLLSDCIRNAHWSIFEMVDATIEIECPRDIGRQILRHRTFTFQELASDMLKHKSIHGGSHDYKIKRIDRIVSQVSIQTLKIFGNSFKQMH